MTLRYLSLVVPLKKVGDEAVHKELGDRMERAASTSSSLEVDQDSGSGPRCQDTILGDVDVQTRFKTTSKQFNDPPLSKVNTFGSGEDSIQLMKLMAHCTILCEFVSIKEKRDAVSKKKNRKRDVCLKTERVHCTTEDGVHAITATIDERAKIITEASIRRHLKLQDSKVQPQDEAPSTSPSRITTSPSLSSHHITSNTPTTPSSIQTTHKAEESATIPHDLPLLRGHTPRSDEGRLKHNELMELVTKLSDKDEGTSWFQEDVDTQEKNSADTEVLLEEETPTNLIEDLGSGEKGEKEVSTAGAEVSTGTHDVSTAAAALVYIRRSASKTKDKGKAIMQEPEPPKKLKKRVQVQMSVDEELARKVQEEEQAKAMAEQEKERINFEAAMELQRQLNEREEVQAEATQSQTIDWTDPVVLRYHALQNRPYSVAEVRKNMVMYLNNQAGYKQSFFKGMKYEEIRPIFEKVWDQTHTFIPMDSEDKEKGSKKKAGGSRKKTLAKKRAGEKQSDQSAKRQKTEYDTEKEELKAYLDIVPGEEFAMDFESLATKFPIVDWKTHVLAENFMYYQIFKADGSSKNYKIFSEMLDDFDRKNVMNKCFGEI
ncbi:hypothetical protein Tco_0032262 [Tanacetum coccineum]